jgi:hypothetical protein
MRIEELSEIESAGLLDELEIGRARCGVSEGHEHDVGKVERRHFEIEHACCGLDLGL